MFPIQDSDFSLHPQLAADTAVIGDWPLCRVLLMNDASYPWIILVPRRQDAREIFQLSTADQIQLLKESSMLAEELAKAYSADKLNIAALGNMVPQLHVHHVVRFKTDAAWPKPVWGFQPAVQYSDDELEMRLAGFRDLLSDLF